VSKKITMDYEEYQDLMEKVEEAGFIIKNKYSVEFTVYTYVAETIVQATQNTKVYNFDKNPTVEKIKDILSELDLKYDLESNKGLIREKQERLEFENDRLRKEIIELKSKKPKFSWIKK